MPASLARRWLFVERDATRGSELWIGAAEPGSSRVLLDIRSGVGGSTPDSFTPLADGRLLFVADNAASGRELWVSNGLAGGTQLVKDIYPQGSWSSPAALTALPNGRVLFTAEDEEHGAGLWVSDGSGAGTVLLREGEILPAGFVSGAGGIGAVHLVALPSGVALFWAHDRDHGREVWVSNGTAAGTRLLIDIAPADEDAYPSQLASPFTPLSDGRALFVAREPAHGEELWVTDGTTPGTRLVKDITEGEQGTNIGGCFVLPQGRALFTSSQFFGHDLWVTDGSEAGTRRLHTFSLASGGPDTASFRLLPDGRVLFAAQDASSGRELWISDGSAAGTQRLADLVPGAQGSEPVLGERLGDGRMVFLVNHPASGHQLWVSDGSAAGTSRLQNIGSSLGSALAGTRLATQLQFVALDDGRVLFTALDDAHGLEPWVTNGTTEGTRLLADLWPGQGSSTPMSFSRLGDGRVAFVAADPGHGLQRWVSDGTAVGTRAWLDGGDASGPSSPARFHALAGGSVAFSASGTNGREPWVTDGTASGTALLRDLLPGSEGSEPSTGYGFIPLGQGRVLLRVNHLGLWASDGRAGSASQVAAIEASPAAPALLADGRALLVADDELHGDELWVSDGSEAGTHIVVDIRPGADGAGLFYGDGLVRVAADRFVFAADDGQRGSELWLTDGTAAGTQLLLDISAGSAGAEPSGWFRLGDAAVLFRADDGLHGNELWFSDGTAGGTRLVRDLADGSASSRPESFWRMADGRVLFSAFDATHGRELWISDGTASGTRLVKDLAPGADPFFGVYSSAPRGFAALPGGRAAFLAADPASDSLQLCVTDGSTDGTVALAAGGVTGTLAALGDGRLLFARADGQRGSELWISDGTPAGTMLLKELRAGSASSDPANFTPLLDGRVAFTAHDGSHGRELWVSDGSADGTRMVKDIRSGTPGSAPAELFALADGRLLFAADDGIHGAEPWISDGTEAGTTLLRDIGERAAPGAAGLYAITIPNAAPVAAAATASGDEDSAISGQLAASDADGDALSFARHTNPAHGSVVVHADGRYTYTPAPDFNGSDSFSFTAGDGSAVSAPAVVTLAIRPVADAPVVNRELPDLQAIGGRAFSFTFAANLFRDGDGDTLSWSLTREGGGALPAWLSFDAASRTLSGTPTNRELGSLSLRVTASDGSASVSDLMQLAVVPATLLVPDGAEWRVNTVTAGEQIRPLVAALADGSSVVVWRSVVEDPGAWDILAQRVDAQGAAQGAPTLLARQFGGTDLDRLALAPLQGGGYVAAWFTTPESAPEQLLLRRFGADGTPLGEASVVAVSNAASTGSLADWPVLAALGDGGFILGWTAWVNEDLPGPGYLYSYWYQRAQRYAADGQPVGAQRVANTFTGPNDQDQPALAALPGGISIVAWRSAAEEGPFRIRARVIGADGLPVGTDIVVNSHDAPLQTMPAAAALADGSFVVAWQSEQQDGSGEGIYAQRFSAAGTRLGDEFRVNSWTTWDQDIATITPLADGGFVIAWRSFLQDDALSTGVYAQRFSSTGQKLGAEFRLNATVAGDQGWPALTGLADGGLLAAWESTGQDGSGSGIYAQRYALDHAPLFDAAGSTAPVNFVEQTPLVLMPTLALADPDGDAPGSTLSVQIVSGATADDRLRLPQTDPGDGGVWLNGNDVMAGTLAFGRASATEAVAGQAWTFTFDAAATGQRVQALARAVRFDNGSDRPDPSLRTVSFTAADRHGLADQITRNVSVTPVNDPPSGGVAISGDAVSGRTLAATSTLADADGLGVLGYQWLRGGTAIVGASGASYTLVAADIGSTISVRVAYTDGGGTAEAVTSAATATVQPAGIVVSGSAGDDTLSGSSGADSIFGLAGNDVLSGGSGSDTLDGGAGFDVGSWGLAASTTPINASLLTGLVSQGSDTDTLIGIEAIFATAAADTLRAADGLSSQRGETIRGGAGNDTIDGGSGVDAAEYLGARAGYTVTRNGNAISVVDTNSADGSDGSDSLLDVERLVFADSMLAFGTRAEELARVAFVLWTPGIVVSQALFSRGYSYYDNGGYDFATMCGAALTFHNEQGLAFAQKLKANMPGTAKSVDQIFAIMSAAGGGEPGRIAALVDMANDPATEASIAASNIRVTGIVADLEVPGFGTLFGLLPGA